MYSLAADRVIDWSNAGNTGGIPSYTLFADVTDSPYNAVEGDTDDQAAAFQSAIDACPAGQYVYVPAGTFHIDTQLTIDDGIELRGAGMGITTLSVGIPGAVTRAIYINNGGGTGAAQNITAGLTKGTTVITAASGTGFDAGDYVMVYQDNDSDYIKQASGAGAPISEGQRQINKVASRSGNDITLEQPLYYDYTAPFDPEIKEMSNFVVGAGVTNMTLDLDEMTVSQNTSGIRCYRAAECFFYRLEIKEVAEDHLELLDNFRTEVRECYMHHSSQYTAAEPYGIQLAGCSDCRVEDNIVYYCHHGIVVQAGSSGNVIAYNYGHRQYSRDPFDAQTTTVGLCFTFHGTSHMNLVEGNIFSRMFSDCVFGSNWSNAFFRNHCEAYGVDGYGTAQVDGDDSAEIWSVNYYVNFLGNILARSDETQSGQLQVGNNPYDPPATDSNVAATLINHGTYDHQAEAYTWADADHDLADSLYLASAPSFFSGYTWPAIGPESTTPGRLPAKQRFIDTHFVTNDDNDNFIDHWGQYSASAPASRTPAAARRTVLTMA